MKRERIIEFVGGSEDEIAYLRLLLRKAASKLLDRWRLWRDDDSHADVLVIDDNSEAAVQAPPTARGGGQRRVRLIDPQFGAAGIETVLWPLSVEKITQLLNLNRKPPEVERPAVIAPAMIQQNVYDDLFEPDPTGRWHQGVDVDAHFPNLDFTGEWVAPPRAPDSAMMLEAEMLFRTDPRSQHKEAVKAMRLHHDVDVEATEGHTFASGSRKDRRGSIGLAADTTHTLTPLEANSPLPLAAYLTGKLLPGPSRIEAGYVTLTLDPRNRLYYAKGALCVFEDCCKKPMRRGDWRALSVSEFSEVKKQIEPRPFVELLWLSAYTDESAAAATELDSESRYRLTETIELQRDYPRAARVARELQQACTLSAAAATARVTLTEAKRVAAAFDAVGYLIPD